MKWWGRTPDALVAVLTCGLAIVAVLYPFLVLLLLDRFGAFALLALLVGIAVARFALPAARILPAELIVAPIIGAAMMGLIALADPELALRLYPVLMNLGLLFVFGWSLRTGPSMIERFARVAEPDLDANGVRYTRALTIVWIGFFALNGSVALWLALFGSWTAWTSYTGGIAYLLAGLLLGGEYLVRGRIRRRHRATAAS